MAPAAWTSVTDRFRVSHARTGAQTPAVEKPCVYLAECSYDRRDAREGLESELRLHGYTVLPSEPLPKDESDYIDVVSKLLERCTLSIHLVGASGGAVLDGPSNEV